MPDRPVRHLDIRPRESAFSKTAPESFEFVKFASVRTASVDRPRQSWNGESAFSRRLCEDTAGEVGLLMLQPERSAFLKLDPLRLRWTVRSLEVRSVEPHAEQFRPSRVQAGKIELGHLRSTLPASKHRFLKVVHTPSMTEYFLSFAESLNRRPG
jgi:hypothetical protein